MLETGATKELLLEQLLRGRHSCRAFLPDPVPRAVQERLFELAQRSASWCNTQPWHITVTQGAGTERFREVLYTHATRCVTAINRSMEPDIPFPAAYSGALGERRRNMGKLLYEALDIRRGDQAASTQQGLENFRFFSAPHVLLIHVDKNLGPYGAVDCGLYLGTLLLVAESLGIAMIPQAALAGYAALVRDHFGIPDTMACVAGVAFGYADKDHPANSFRTPRASLDKVVSWVSK